MRHSNKFGVKPIVLLFSNLNVTVSSTARVIPQTLSLELSARQNMCVETNDHLAIPPNSKYWLNQQNLIRIKAVILLLDQS